LRCRALSSVTDGPLFLYEQGIARNEIQSDDLQLAALKPLQKLHEQLKLYELPAIRATISAPDSSTDSNGFFSSFFGGGDSPGEAAAAPAAPEGVYLWGGVGCGKTYIMDLFFEASPLERKSRVHFHSFMLDIHNRMHALRKGGLREDPIPHITREILNESVLICFDEFQVTDVADALILRRLFAAMMEMGMVVVATSNRPPQDLYKNGLQRELFVPFIHYLEESMVVHGMDSSTDYRRVKGIHKESQIYFLADQTKGFEDLWTKMTEGAEYSEATLMALGHEIKVPLVAQGHNTAMFGFNDLCAKPLGAADYLAIAQAFHTVFIRDVPSMTLNEINLVRRFITLIDTFYDGHIKVVVLAAAEPLELFVPPKDEKGLGEKDEVFAFDRTVSRC
jgi:predicted ATPase